jgi:hypothetical protein
MSRKSFSSGTATVVPHERSLQFKWSSATWAPGSEHTNPVTLEDLAERFRDAGI